MSRKSILVVDDEKSQREILEMILSGEGYDVTTASSGEAAMKFVESRRFDLVLTDFAMPGFNGVQTINRIRALRPGMRSALMTGYADESLSAVDRQSMTVFRKPLDIDELMGFLAS